ncbi:hypothetical protein FJZ26_03485 [Candidatus Parvarchaeota archaeon]|nr:hypothetical protein [Candidatus Parvarchaeota archaeon]
MKTQSKVDCIEICPKCKNEFKACEYESYSSPTPYSPISGFVVCSKCGYRGMPICVKIRDLKKIREISGNANKKLR